MLAKSLVERLQELYQVSSRMPYFLPGLITCKNNDASVVVSQTLILVVKLNAGSPGVRF